MAAVSHHCPGFPMPTMTASPMRSMASLLMGLLLISMTGAAFAGKKSSELERNQYSFSAAIRWADFGPIPGSFRSSSMSFPTGAG